MQSGSNHPRRVSYVNHQPGADKVGNVAETFKINNPRVGAGSSHNQLGLVLQGESLQLRVVNSFCFPINSVADEIIRLA